MRRDAPVHPRREFLREVLHERRNVVRPLAQRRIEDREHVEAIVEIAAELLVGDHLREIAVGRRHEPDVDADGAVAAQPLELLLLQHAQEFRLQLERNVADFVEEQRAAVRELEAADLLRDGARERAFLVSEQLALEQARRNRGAVQLDERPRSAAAQVVDGSGDELLARAGLSLDEHGRVGRRDNLDLREHVLQRTGCRRRSPRSCARCEFRARGTASPRSAFP